MSARPKSQNIVSNCFSYLSLVRKPTQNSLCWVSGDARTHKALLWYHHRPTVFTIFLANRPSALFTAVSAYYAEIWENISKCITLHILALTRVWKEKNLQKEKELILFKIRIPLMRIPVNTNEISYLPQTVIYFLERNRLVCFLMPPITFVKAEAKTLNRSSLTSAPASSIHMMTVNALINAVIKTRARGSMKRASCKWMSVMAYGNQLRSNISIRRRRKDTNQG